MLTDQRLVFLAHGWNYNGESEKIHLKSTVVETHNSSGAGEPYHPILRRVYNNTSTKNTNVRPDMSLAMAVRDLIRTVPPNAL